MRKFTQLGNDFEAQENNWIKGAKKLYLPKGYTDSTQVLIAAQIQRRGETAEDYIERTENSVKDLDWEDFNQLIMKLRPLPLSIYKLSRLHYYRDSLGRWQPIYRRKWAVLQISEYKFEQQLAWTIDSIKRWGGLE